jgi:methylamine---glutamate N-methyltransferase subunit A
MCGIVGLLLKRPGWHARLGELVVPMLVGMTDRGPDSAGLAVFGAVAETGLKLSLWQADGVPDWSALGMELAAQFPGFQELDAQGRHAILHSAADPAALQSWLTQRSAPVTVLSVGRSIDLYKDVGAPAAIAQRYDFESLQGSHVVAHTRMATESAVTPAHAHPFTAGQDFCLVHNGSLSNPNLVRRKLEPLGIHFETDNDTEAACRYFEWRMREGDDIEVAMQSAFQELDGFFTFLIGTANELALVRDPFACKPAIVAETDDYVAIASEFRSLAHLPGVANAALFEPQPGKVYTWRLS